MIYVLAGFISGALAAVSLIYLIVALRREAALRAECRRYADDRAAAYDEPARPTRAFPWPHKDAPQPGDLISEVTGG